MKEQSYYILTQYVTDELFDLLLYHRYLPESRDTASHFHFIEKLKDHDIEFLLIPVGNPSEMLRLPNREEVFSEENRHIPLVATNIIIRAIRDFHAVKEKARSPLTYDAFSRLPEGVKVDLHFPGEEIPPLISVPTFRIDQETYISLNDNLRFGRVLYEGREGTNGWVIANMLTVVDHIKYCARYINMEIYLSEDQMLKAKENKLSIKIGKINKIEFRHYKVSDLMGAKCCDEDEDFDDEDEDSCEDEDCCKEEGENRMFQNHIVKDIKVGIIHPEVLGNISKGLERVSGATRKMGEDKKVLTLIFKGFKPLEISCEDLPTWLVNKIKGKKVGEVEYYIRMLEELGLVETITYTSDTPKVEDLF